MKFDDLYVVSDRLQTASPADVAAAEVEIGCRFPVGYSEYVERFGAGSLDDLLRVFLPDRILAEIGSWRETKDRYWFWTDPESQVDKATVLGAIPLGDSENGDEFCFHPDDPDTVIVLPRDDERSFAVGGGLFGAVDWVFSSGVLQRPGRPTAFEPHEGRMYIRHQTGRGGNLTSLQGALLALGLHALAYEDPSGDYSVVYFPSIKGRVVLMRFDTGEVDALIVHDDEVPRASITPIQAVLEGAGAPFRTRWGRSSPRDEVR